MKPRSRVLISLSILFILLLGSILISFNASANYSSIPDLNSELSMTSNVNSTPIYMKSEDILFLIDKDEIAYVTAEYVLTNTLDEEHMQTLYLPFLQKPRNLTISIADSQINFEWFTMSIRFQIPDWESEVKSDWNEYESIRRRYDNNYTKYYWDEYFDYGYTIEFDAISHDYVFEPKESIRITVEYDRNIRSGLNEPRSDIDEKWDGYPDRPTWGHGDWAENFYYYKCLYIARTGSTWNQSIEKATFTFKIHKDILNSDHTFVDGSVHDFEYGYSWNIYLKEITGNEGDYVILSETYYNWTPINDIGVCWLVPRTEREYFNTFLEDHRGKVILAIVSAIILFIVLIVIISYRIEKKRANPSKR